MRTSDWALLRRKPSEYMREMFYTSQPMEMVDNCGARRVFNLDPVYSPIKRARRARVSWASGAGSGRAGCRSGYEC